MKKLRPLILVQALSPTSRTAFSEASLCGALLDQVPTRVLCRKWAVDYSFAKSFGLNEIVEYEPRDVFHAWKNPRHWLHAILKDSSLLHLNGYGRWEDPLLALLCLRFGIPLIVQPRGALIEGTNLTLALRGYHYSLGQFVLHRAKRVIALSQFEAKGLRELGIASKKMEIIPNGVTLPPAFAARPLSSQPVPGVATGNYFFYLGRIDEEKNLPFLLEVFHRYRQQGGTLSLYLMGPSTKNYHSTLQRKIGELGLEKVVSLLSPSYDEARWQWLSRATALLYPSLDEAFGRVPFEALFAGALAVVPDCGGSAEYLRPLLPQCVYHHRDPNDLCRILLELQNMPAAERLKMVTHARKWVEDELHWERISAAVLGLYAEVSGHKVDSKVSVKAR